MAELIAPWLWHVALLLTVDSMPSAADLRDRLWVDVALSDDRSHWPAQFDALELLARFARLDSRSAWTLPVMRTRASAYLEDIVSSMVPMRFRLAVPPAVLADATPRATLQDLLGWHSGNQDRRTHAPGFTTAKEAIVAFGQNASEDDEATLCIQQRFGRSTVESSEAELARLVALADIQRAVASRPTNGFQWKWTHVALYVMYVRTLDTIYDYLGRLLDRGVRLERLQANNRAAIVNGNVATHFWCRSLAANGFDSLLLPTAMDYLTFQSICRGLATTTTTTMTATTRNVNGCYRPSIFFDVADGASDFALRWAWLTAVRARAADHPERTAPRVVLSFSGLQLPQARVIAGSMAAHQKRPRAEQQCTATTIDRFVILRATVRADVSATSSGQAVADATALRVVEGASTLCHTCVHWVGSPDGVGWVHNTDVVRVDDLDFVRTSTRVLSGSTT